MFQDGSDRWSTFTPRASLLAVHTSTSPLNAACGTPPTTPQTSARMLRAKARPEPAAYRSHQPPRTTGIYPKVGHTARFRREQQASQRIPTVNAHRQILTQTTEQPPIKGPLRSGASDSTDHRQSRQLYPFRPLWFHVLLNSLFKVLFNFPSQYLFAIGFEMIFSLGCGIPPTLSCISKQLDSKTPPTKATTVRTGLTPSLEEAFQQTSDSNHSRERRLYATPPKR